MTRTRATSLPFAVLLSFVVLGSACSDDDSGGPTGPGAGEEGGPCLVGDRCNPGLTCQAAVCLPGADLDAGDDTSDATPDTPIDSGNDTTNDTPDVPDVEEDIVDGGSDADADDADANVDTVSVSGSVGKGPYLSGTLVSVSATDARGVEVSPSFSTTVDDDLGQFALPVAWDGPVAVTANGMFVDEGTGIATAEAVSLRARADLTGQDAVIVHVNALTHMSFRRVGFLLDVADRPPLTEAMSQAEAELCAALDLGDGTCPTAAASISLIDGDTAASQYLFAVSAVILRAARIVSARDSVTVEAATQGLLNRIELELENGTGLPSEVSDLLVEAEQSLDTAAYRAELQTHLDLVGGDRVAPDLDQVIDSDGDEIANASDNCPSVANVDQSDSNGDGVGDACCGNGDTEGDEVCDDGDDIDGNGCDNNCTPTGCGNGVVTEGEGCDDGNNDDNDACGNDCCAHACDSIGIMCVADVLQQCVLDINSCRATVDTTCAAGCASAQCLPLEGEGALVWSYAAGGTADQSAHAVDYGGDGSLAITGSLVSSVEFGDTPDVTSVGPDPAERMFVARFMPDDSLAWVRDTESDTGSVVGRGVALAAPGVVTVGGTFSGTATFGPTEPMETALTSASNTGDNAFLARYGPGGDLMWASHISSATHVEVTDVVRGPAGRTLVMGLFDTSATFSPGEPSEAFLTGAGIEGFVAAYNNAGALTWVEQLGGPGNDWVVAGAPQPDGGLVVTGGFLQDITLGEGDTEETSLTSDMDEDVFVARYDGDGTLIWAKQVQGGIGTDTLQVVASIATSPDGDTTITGHMREQTIFGLGEPTETIFSPSDIDGYVARYDTAGRLVWVRAITGGLGEAITVRQDGSAVAVGSSDRTNITLNAGRPDDTTLPLELADGWIAGFEVNGNLMWSAALLGADGVDAASYIETTAVLGEFTAPTNLALGGAELTHRGGRDLFIAKFR